MLSSSSPIMMIFYCVYLGMRGESLTQMVSKSIGVLTKISLDGRRGTYGA